jgi:hypothetical protein
MTLRGGALSGTNLIGWSYCFRWWTTKRKYPAQSRPPPWTLWKAWHRPGRNQREAQFIRLRGQIEERAARKFLGNGVRRKSSRHYLA